MSCPIKLPTTRYQKIMNILTILLIAGQFLCLILYWPSLPAKIPTHFGISGEPDGWGGKGSLLFLPGLTIPLFLLLMIVERYPNLWNVPGPVTEANSLWIYSNVKSMLVTMKFFIAAMFFYINLQSARCTGLAIWFLPVSMIALFGSMAFFLIRAKRY